VRIPIKACMHIRMSTSSLCRFPKPPTRLRRGKYAVNPSSSYSSHKNGMATPLLYTNDITESFHSSKHVWVRNGFPLNVGITSLFVFNIRLLEFTCFTVRLRKYFFSTISLTMLSGLKCFGFLHILVCNG
jgi:hypothetical protein